MNIFIFVAQRMNCTVKTILYTLLFALVFMMFPRTVVAIV
jgi:hypothetical protein